MPGATVRRRGLDLGSPCPATTGSGRRSLRAARTASQGEGHPFVFLLRVEHSARRDRPSAQLPRELDHVRRRVAQCVQRALRSATRQPPSLSRYENTRATLGESPASLYTSRHSQTRQRASTDPPRPTRKPIEPNRGRMRAATRLSRARRPTRNRRVLTPALRGTVEFRCDNAAEFVVSPSGASATSGTPRCPPGGPVPASWHAASAGHSTVACQKLRIGLKEDATNSSCVVATERLLVGLDRTTKSSRQHAAISRANVLER